LYGAGGGRRIDTKAIRQALHCAVSLSQEVERIHLSLFERVVFAEVVGTEGRSAGTATELGPGLANAESVSAVDGVA
jgi:hypothetical protein